MITYEQGAQQPPTDMTPPGQRRPRPIPSVGGGLQPPPMPGVERFNGPMVNSRRPMMTAPGAPNTSPSPASPPQMPPATPPSPAPVPAVGAMPSPGYATVTPINPNADLRNQQIAPGATPDRLSFAQRHYDQFAADNAPKDEASRRALLKNGAAFGRMGSGMLRTDFGNLSDSIDARNTNERNRLFTNAAEAAVGDQANLRGELRGERGYQTGQEADAFNRARQQLFDEDALTGSRFGRDVTRAQFGYGNNPSTLMAAIGESMGKRAAGSAASVGQSAGDGGYLDLLKKIMTQQGGPAPGSPGTTPPIVDPSQYDPFTY